MVLDPMGGVGTIAIEAGHGGAWIARGTSWQSATIFWLGKPCNNSRMKMNDPNDCYLNGNPFNSTASGNSVVDISTDSVGCPCALVG